MGAIAGLDTAIALADHENPEFVKMLFHRLGMMLYVQVLWGVSSTTGSGTSIGLRSARSSASSGSAPVRTRSPGDRALRSSTFWAAAAWLLTGLRTGPLLACVRSWNSVHTPRAEGTNDAEP